ncbi:galactose ABC transporter substrate-binding protein [Clostridium sp.]|uniref:galactose ABC transporter substrate-binding protein n=1 Tax=Clostridium sp. TaxID=1506 RepID=UPI00284E6F4E|nr:galactose ABC transporter substrate-binding protein [Clostridium sp.]MDR3594647.1 galactose ABC transporter substrate-binding protein [Clostridium sp.]
MKILNKIGIIILVTLMIFTLIDITKINIFASQILNNNSEKPVNVAVLLYSFDDLFMSRLKQSFEDLQKENSDKVRFTFYDGKNNIAIQEQGIDFAIQNGADLIMANLADVSERSVQNVISRVKEKNVPIVILDVAPQVVSEVSKDFSKAAYILANSDKAGEAEGKILADLWNKNKAVLDKNNDNILQYILLQGDVANPVSIDRTKYVISTLNDSGIQTQQLELVNAIWLKELAKSSMESLFLKYDGRTEAIISNNDAMAIGAIEALQEYGYNEGDKTKNIAVVGIDGLPEAKELVDKGSMTGTVTQDPKVLAEVFYNVGMNLVYNLNPTENTNYKVVNREIIIPFPYQAYVRQTNTL